MEKVQPKTEYRTRSSQVISLEKGKLPPQATDLEEVILGAMMIDSRGVTEAIETIGKNEVFYKTAHQEIYNAILQLYENGEPVDLLTVSGQLKKTSKLEISGGEFYLVQLSQKVSSSANIIFHSRIVVQEFVKREAIKMAGNISEQAYDVDVDIFDLLADSHKALDDVMESISKKTAPDFKKQVADFFDRAKDQSPGVPSKLSKIQNKTNGYHPTDLVIVAARPGMGKTALVINEAKYQASLGIPVGFFSLEMSAAQLIGRMVSDAASVNASDIKNNKLNETQRAEIDSKRSEIESLPLHINDNVSITPLELRLQVGKWVRDHGVKIIYIDYLQLMSAPNLSKGTNREGEISYISRSLKATAKEFNIPVIALSQLSRAVETRGGMKRPILSDLRESGAIEQDADIVYFVYRPEYYKIEEWDDDDRTPTKDQCELIMAKGRGDMLGATVVRTNLRYMRFEDLEEDFYSGLPIEPGSPEGAFDAPNETKLQKDEDEDLP